MNVNSYIFQSPYSNQVQIGRLDPSSSNNETSVNQEATNTIQQAAKQAPKFENMDTQKTTETEPVQTSNTSLDLYA